MANVRAMLESKESIEDPKYNWLKRNKASMDLDNNWVTSPHSTFEIEITSLEWFHPHLDRHLSESLLLHNGNEGAYLLRPCSNGGYSLSVRGKDSVKHYNMTWDGENYCFGQGKYKSIEELVEHFQNQPLIAGETGILTVLKFPYPRKVEEPRQYDSIRVHAELGEGSRQAGMRAESYAVASKEGYLTKQGGKVKNWKTRWFVLQKYELKYFRDNRDRDPVRTLDLGECQYCEWDSTQGKTNCIKLVFPWRSFFMYANSKKDAEDWFAKINYKLDNKS